MNDNSDKEVEPTPFATKEACAKWRKVRRFREFNWLGVGRVILQSAMAGEWIRIDAAQTRARMAAMSGNAKVHEKATKEFLVAVCTLLVLDENKNPFFSRDDETLIVEMDSAITDPLVAAAMQHCDTSGVDFEAAKKN